MANFFRPKQLSDVLIREFEGFTNRTVTFAGGVFVMGQVVAKLNGNYVPLVPAANDDSAKAAGICLVNVDASAANKSGLAAVKLAQLMPEGLVWPAGITDAQKAIAVAQLEALFIVMQDPQ
jgi:hypothetical protein